MPDPMIVADPSLRMPQGQEYWTTAEMIDARGRPTFSVGEVAKCFFGMSGSWVRQQLRIDYEIHGEVFEPLRSPAGDRYFRLYDIERWAHALGDYGVIDGRHLELIIVAVKNTAQLYRFIS